MVIIAREGTQGMWHLSRVSDRDRDRVTCTTKKKVRWPARFYIRVNFTRNENSKMMNNVLQGYKCVELYKVPQ